MWKVVRKGLLANKVRYLLTAIAVVLGVAFISGTFVLTSTITQSFDDLFGNIYRGTDAVVRAKEVLTSGDFGGGAQRPNIPESLLRVVRAVPSVQDAEGNVDTNKSYAQLIDRKGKAVGGVGGAPAIGIGWDPNPILNSFRIVQGHPPRRDDEIVIDKGSATKGKFHVGDRVKVLTAKQPRFYTLVGIAKFGTADSLLGASMTLFTLDEAQRINNSVGQFGQISVLAKPGVSQEQVKDDIAAALAAQGAQKTEVLTGKQITKEQQDQVHKAVNTFNIALTAFGFIALIVGAFIIYNTFSITVAQRAREMALLRALGASRRQVLGQITLEAVVVGVFASVIGVAAGIGLAIGLRSLLNAIGFSLPQTTIVIPASGVIFGLVVGSGITLLSAVVPARQAARIPPIAALRDFSLEQPIRRLSRFATGAMIFVVGILLMLIGLFTGVSNTIWYVVVGAVVIFAGAFVLGPVFSPLVSRVIGAPIAAIKGITGSLSRENAARHPKRTTTTAIPLVIGVALVGFITIFAASASATVTHAVDTQFKTDFLVTAGSGFGAGSGFSPDLATSIGKLHQVQAETGVRFNFAAIDGKRIQVNAVDPVGSAQVVDFGDVAGKFSDLTDNGLAISKRKADEQHWHFGDTVPVTFVKTGTKPMRVEYIYKQNTFGDYYISDGAYDKNYDQRLDFLVLVKLKDGVSAKDGRAAIEPLVKRYPTAKLVDNAQYKDDQIAQFNALVRVIYVLLFLSVIIAMIGIANTLILSIHERTHEVGLLRAVGMGRSQVRSSIRWESVIICLIGTLNGLAIGLFFGWAFVRALRDEGFSQFAIAPGRLVIVAVALAILSVVAGIFPARRASKLDILRAIATE